MDHFIVGALVWGLLFAAFDARLREGAYWLKGLIFGVFAWVLMMVLFMPMAKAGFFGAKIGMQAPLVTLMHHVVYGLVLGVTYGMLATWAPVKTAELTRQQIT